DLSQGFVVSKVLGQDLIARADRGKGKFRTWLLTALDRYLISQWRQTAARRSGPGAAKSPRSASPAEGLGLAWARGGLARGARRGRGPAGRTGGASSTAASWPPRWRGRLHFLTTSWSGASGSTRRCRRRTP